MWPLISNCLPQRYRVVVSAAQRSHAACQMFMNACETGDSRKLQLALAHVENVDAQQAQVCLLLCGRTASHYSVQTSKTGAILMAENGHTPKLVQLLAAKGANFLIPTKSGKLPADLVPVREHADLIWHHVRVMPSAIAPTS